MKKRREKHITRLHIILFFLVLVISLSIFIGVKTKQASDDKNYKMYVSVMEDAARSYSIIYHVEIEDGEQEIIELEDLKDSNLVYDIPDDCDGYVIALSEENIETEEFEVNYTAELKCGNKFSTSNYSEEREE